MSDQTQAAFAQLYESYFGDEHLEEGELAALPQALENCDIFIDAGASLGVYTFHANQILKNKKIISIEADPDRYAELKKNCEKWQQEGNNEIIAVNAIVSDENGETTFYKTGSTISGAVFKVEERADEYEAVKVEQVCLDKFYEEGKRFVAKVDVEGAELRVLEGSTRHLSGRKTDFLIELHWWGDRERGTTSMDVLWKMFSHRMAMIRPAKEHKSHYLWRPAFDGEPLFPEYALFSPLLFAKSMYGKYAPRQVRDFREKLIKSRRKKKYGAAV